MTSYLSEKIKISSFLLMLLVVFIHCHNINLEQSEYIPNIENKYIWIVEQFISNGISRIAVPLFFMISGYLFLLNTEFNRSNYILKIKKRINTLFVPYIIWTFFGILFYFTLQSIPGIQNYFTDKLIVDYNLQDWFRKIFLEPIPYQLWFIRDLFVLTVFSPLLYFLIKSSNIIFNLILFSFWIFNLDFFIISIEAIFFFTLGLSIYINKYKFLPFKFYSILPIWFIILIVKILIRYFDYPYIVENLLLKISILIGLIAFWHSYDLYYDKIMKFQYLKSFLPYTFFLYLSHEPFLTVIKKILFKFLPNSPFIFLIIYFFSFLIVTLVCTSFGKYMYSATPRLYKLLTGNR